MALTAISLFSGAGGLDLGVEQAGFTHVLALDSDPAAVTVYNDNFSRPAICADADGALASDIPSRILSNLTPAVDLLHGGPPCQPWSSARANPTGSADVRDGFPSYARWLRRVMPRAFLVENVPGFTRRQFDGPRNAFIDVAARLGYTVFDTRLTATSYGVAQRRTRWFCVGFKSPADAQAFSWPTPTTSPPLTVRDVLDRFEYDDVLGMFKFADIFAPVSERVRSRMEAAKTIPWAIAQKHPPAVMDEPSRTVTANWRRGGYYGLVETDVGLRRFTPLAMSLLQGFPATFNWSAVAPTVAMRLIGNAVPPPLAYAVANAIRQALDNA